MEEIVTEYPGHARLLAATARLGRTLEVFPTIADAVLVDEGGSSIEVTGLDGREYELHLVEITDSEEGAGCSGLAC